MRIEEYKGYSFREDGVVFSKAGKQLKIREHKGKLEVKISEDGKRKYLLMHRVMYYLFIERFDINNKDLCVTVKDGNFKNISLDNLLLKKRGDLIQGSYNKRSKLTEEEVKLIRSEYKGKAGTNQLDKIGPSYLDLAKKYNVTKDNIKHIIKGLTRNKDKYKL